MATLSVETNELRAARENHREQPDRVPWADPYYARKLASILSFLCKINRGDHLRNGGGNPYGIGRVILSLRSNEGYAGARSVFSSLHGREESIC